MLLMAHALKIYGGGLKLCAYFHLLRFTYGAVLLLLAYTVRIDRCEFIYVEFTYIHTKVYIALLWIKMRCVYVDICAI